MNSVSPVMMDKAFANGIIQKGAIHAVAERMRSYEQRFNERPRISVSEGSLPAHEQIEIQFFQKDQGIEMVMSPEDGFLHMRNLTSNQILGIEFDTRQGLIHVDSGSIGRDLSIEKIIVDESSKLDMPEFSERLSNVIIVDNDGASIDSLQDQLRKHDPKATFVERSQFNEHFLINKVVGSDRARELFVQEFEQSTGPRILDNVNKLYKEPVHEVSTLEM